MGIVLASVRGHWSEKSAEGLCLTEVIEYVVPLPAFSEVLEMPELMESDFFQNWEITGCLVVEVVVARPRK